MVGNTRTTVAKEHQRTVERLSQMILPEIGEAILNTESLSIIQSLKGLKGKGEAAKWAASLEREIRGVWAGMHQLCDATRTVPNRAVILQAHKRGIGMMLYWRDSVTTKHLRWEVASELVFKSGNQILINWYEEINELAQFLNVKEYSLRKSIKSVNGYLAERMKTMPLYQEQFE